MMIERATALSEPAGPSLDQIQNNWGGFLLIQARTKTGEEREKLLEQAWGHAMESETLSPTMSAYNLACIAAERGDPVRQHAGWATLLP
jgi:hypothetical protein